MDWLPIESIKDKRALDFIKMHNLESNYINIIELCITSDHCEFLSYCLDNNFKLPNDIHDISFSFQSLQLFHEHNLKRDLKISYSNCRMRNSRDFDNMEFQILKNSLGFDTNGFCEMAIRKNNVEMVIFALQHERFNVEEQKFRNVIETAIKCNSQVIFDILFDFLTERNELNSYTWLFEKCVRTLDPYYALKLIPYLDKKFFSPLNCVVENDRLDLFLLMKNDFPCRFTIVETAIVWNSLLCLKYFLDNEFWKPYFKFGFSLMNATSIPALSLIFLFQRSYIPENLYSIEGNYVKFKILFDSYDGQFDCSYYVDEHYEDEVYLELKRKLLHKYDSLNVLIHASPFYFGYDAAIINTDVY
jgi:hypothetical protein